MSDKQKPRAWAVLDNLGNVAQVFIERKDAKAAVERNNDDDYGIISSLAPLYLEPQPTLTAEEREAVEAAAGGYEDESRTFRAEGSPDEAAHHAERAAALRGLLERLT